MRRLHILSSGLRAQNARSFIVPASRAGARLRDLGWTAKLYFVLGPEIGQCDALLVDNKVFATLKCDQRAGKVELLSSWSGQCKIGYFDLSDSTVVTDPEVLPYITLYYKNQLPADRSWLKKPLYGNRLFTDACHHEFGVMDGALESWSTPLEREEIEKLRVGWNAGLGNYALLAPKVSSLVHRMTGLVVSGPRPRYCDPHATRPLDVNCRMATNHSRQTVAHQRREARRILEDFATSNRVSKFQYMRELRRSKIVVSPFGWGEINQKDFEAMIAGAALLKPDLSHLETWPNYFEDGITYVGHRWDLSDLREKLELLLTDDDRRLNIAEEGQRRVRVFSVKGAGLEGFARRLAGIGDELLSAGNVAATAAQA
jgi:hypothetical protein